MERLLDLYTGLFAQQLWSGTATGLSKALDGTVSHDKSLGY